MNVLEFITMVINDEGLKVGSHAAHSFNITVNLYDKYGRIVAKVDSQHQDIEESNREKEGE